MCAAGAAPERARFLLAPGDECLDLAWHRGTDQPTQRLHLEQDPPLAEEAQLPCRGIQLRYHLLSRILPADGVGQVIEEHRAIGFDTAGIGFIIATHDPQASALADAVYDISDGVLTPGVRYPLHIYGCPPRVVLKLVRRPDTFFQLL
jgi:hypothetical protein